MVISQKPFEELFVVVGGEDVGSVSHGPTGGGQAVFFFKHRSVCFGGTFNGGFGDEQPKV